MAQGFYRPSDNPALPQPVTTALPSVLQFSTGRKLDHRLFKTDEEADLWQGFTPDEFGCDTMRIGWTETTLEALDLRIGSEDWTSGFKHELVEHLMTGGTLPYLTTHAGQATATLISPRGHCLTNFHLVSASIWLREMTTDADGDTPAYPTVNTIPHDTFVTEGAPAPHMNLLTADGEALGPVRLCYHDSSKDLAVLKLEIPPSTIAPAPLRSGPAIRHERIWQFGYPPRSAHPDALKTFLGYDDLQGDLTYSPGLLVSNPNQPMWHTDADAAFGSSGSAVFGDDGALIGVRCGGGAAALPREERFKFNRVTDVYGLRQLIPEIF